MRHEVVCLSCQVRFDTVAAELCSCIGIRSSPACPACGRCFCRQSLPAWNRFWEAAPQELWDRVASLRNGAASAPVASPVSATAPLVLVIDDQRICRVTAARTLESFGLRVLEAADGVEGLRLAREHRPKMVLTDALMPKLDGRELCRLVKQDPLLAGTQVAVMTSLYTSPSQRNEGMQVFRADAWLAKPVDAAKLREVVTRLVGPG